VPFRFIQYTCPMKVEKSALKNTILPSTPDHTAPAGGAAHIPTANASIDAAAQAARLKRVSPIRNPRCLLGVKPTTVKSRRGREFQATVKGIGPKPKPCANGDFICGSATTNYGDATWTLNPTSETPPPPGASCGTYAATVTFALGDASSSTLVLDDNGTICPPPGNSLSAPGALQSFGNPFYLTGSWTVEAATGEFGSISVGSRGTDSLHIAGALACGTYVTP
jgi:hypothetical protein